MQKKITILLNVNNILQENYTNKNISVGDIFDEADIYSYSQRIHHTYEDFIDGDLGDRIEQYEQYRVEIVDIDDIDLNEFSVDEDMVDEYKEKIQKSETYPPIVLNRDFSIIDGTHRANALNDLGIKTIVAFVGIKK